MNPPLAHRIYWRLGPKARAQRLWHKAGLPGPGDVPNLLEQSDQFAEPVCYGFQLVFLRLAQPDHDQSP